MPEQGPVPRPRRRKESGGDAVPRPRTPREPEPAANGHAEPPGPSPAFRRYVEALEEMRGAVRGLVAAPETAFEWEKRANDERMRQLEQGAFVEQVGLGFDAFSASGARLRLTRLREGRGDLWCLLDVTRWGLHIYQARYNVSSGQQRVSTSKILRGHPLGGDVNWQEVLEQTCLAVLELQRAGTATEEVGMNEMQPEPPSVLRPYLPRGATLLWAAQGTGKSTVAAAVAVSLEAVAEVLPGWEFVEPRKVLVLDWEASAGEWNDRIRRIAEGAGCEPPSIAYRRMRVPLADQVEEIAEECDRRGIGYLLVDSVEKAAGASEGGTYEDKAERLFLALDRIGRDSLMVDHVTGEDMRAGVGKVHVKAIGSNLKGAWARATYDLKRDPDRSTGQRVEMIMHNVKINQRRPLPPYEFAMVYDGDEHTGPIRFERSALTSPELMESLPMGDRMWRVLAGSGKALGVKELADELGTTQGNVRAIYSRDQKADRHRFVKLPDGSIGLVQAGLMDE